MSEKKEESNYKDTESIYSNFKKEYSASYKVTVLIYETPVKMEIDTDAALSVIDEDTYKQLCSQGKLPFLKSTEVVLRAYTGEKVKPKGTLDATIYLEGTQLQLSLLVVAGKGVTSKINCYVN